MHSPLGRRAAFVVALLTATTSLAALSRTEPGAIRATAERYVASLAPAGVSVHATAGRLDERLNLAACAGDLTPFLPSGATVRPRTLVGVRCGGDGGWSIYVPVTVESEAPLVVARRALSAGERPAATDLEVATRRVAGLATQFLTQPAAIDGRRLRRPIAAGDPVPIAALAAATLVARGQQVTLVAGGPAVAVRAEAVAVDSGGHGDRIRVRSAASGRLLEGVIQPDGTVAIGTVVPR